MGKARDAIRKFFNGFAYTSEKEAESHRTPKEGVNDQYQSLVMRRQWNGKYRVDEMQYENASHYLAIGMGEFVPTITSIQIDQERYGSYIGHFSKNCAKDLTREKALGFLQRYDVMSGPGDFVQENDIKPHENHYSVLILEPEAKAKKAPQKKPPKTSF